MKTLILGVVCLTTPLLLVAGEFTTKNIDLQLEGGISAGYFGTSYSGSSNHDNFMLSDLFFEVLSSEPQASKVSIAWGGGFLRQTTVLDGNGNAGGYTPATSINFDTYYGIVTYKPVDAISIELGQLDTWMGYEVAPSFANWNVTRGVLSTAQPSYYSGLRSSYAHNETIYYIEVNEDPTLGNSTAFALGLQTQLSKIKLNASYVDSRKGRNLLDLVAIFKNTSNILAINLNYHYLDSSGGSNNKDAFGVAVYGIHSQDSVDIALRIEFVDDDNSGIYTHTLADRPTNKLGGSYTISFTPSYYVAENAFLRGEISYISSENDIYLDNDGKRQSTNLSAALQMGVYF